MSDPITTTMNIIYAEQVAMLLRLLENKRMSLNPFRGKLGLPAERVVEFDTFQEEFISTADADFEVVPADAHVQDLYGFKYSETAKLFIELLFLHTEMGGNIKEK